MEYSLKFRKFSQLCTLSVVFIGLFIVSGWVSITGSTGKIKGPLYFCLLKSIPGLSKSQEETDCFLSMTHLAFL
uniref:Uncharacterized protein n=1 Tax=Panstrongylus lignarius TaxID=156445 RepID=A0A224Y454_9HEMI